MALKVGDKAPDFELTTKSAEGPKKVKLSVNFGTKNTVLLFFPMAFTGVCTKEMCRLRDSSGVFQAVGAQVVGISVNDPFTNKAFAVTNGLSFPILSDYTRKTITGDDIFHEDFAGLKSYTAPKRSVFILDEAGTVRYKWVSEDPSKEPDYEEVIRQLSQLVVK